MELSSLLCAQLGGAGVEGPLLQDDVFARILVDRVECRHAQRAALGAFLALRIGADSNDSAVVLTSSLFSIALPGRAAEG
mgnify:CR=1 FL=1